MKKKIDKKLKKIQDKYLTQYPVPLFMDTWNEKMVFLRQIHEEEKYKLSQEITRWESPLNE
jgi:hypothetical protein